MLHPTPPFLISALVLLLGLGATSCSSPGDQQVWTKNSQLMKGDDSFFIQAVCYHPVPVGQEKRSFETLTQDLAIMREMGVNALRVYEPIASQEVLDEISEAGLSVIIGFGYDQGGIYDLKSGTYLDYVQAFKSHPAILLWELGNEYNYHPEWFDGSLDVWYETLREASAAIQAEDPNHPVSTAHGEVPDEALLASLPDVDVWGLNVYRWDVSYTAALDFAKVSDKAMYFSELGSDSFMKTAAPGYDAGENQGHRPMPRTPCSPPSSLILCPLSASPSSPSRTGGGRPVRRTGKTSAVGRRPARACRTTELPTKSTGAWWTSTANRRKPLPWYNPFLLETPPHA